MECVAPEVSPQLVLIAAASTASPRRSASPITPDGPPDHNRLCPAIPVATGVPALSGSWARPRPAPIAEAGLRASACLVANAALRHIGTSAAERLAQESGIETPTLARWTASARVKKLSNQDWVAVAQERPRGQDRQDEASIGTTHLAYKPEHAVDLDTGAVVAAELHPAEVEGDTTTLPQDPGGGRGKPRPAVDVAQTAEDPAECVTDKGYHSRLGLEGARRRPLEEHGSPSPCRRVLRAPARR